MQFQRHNIPIQGAQNVQLVRGLFGCQCFLCVALSYRPGTTIGLFDAPQQLTCPLLKPTYKENNLCDTVTQFTCGPAVYRISERNSISFHTKLVYLARRGDERNTPFHNEPILSRSMARYPAGNTSFTNIKSAQFNFVSDGAIIGRL